MIRRLLDFLFEMMLGKKKAYPLSQRRFEPPQSKYATPPAGRSRVDLNNVSNIRVRSSSIPPGSSQARLVQPLNRNPSQEPQMGRGRLTERTPARPTMNPRSSILDGRSRLDLNADGVSRIRSCSAIPAESSQSRVMPLRRSPSHVPFLRRIRSEEMTPTVPRIVNESEVESRLSRGLLRNDTSANNQFNNLPLPDMRPPTAQESCLSFETCSEPDEDWILSCDNARDLERATCNNMIFPPRIYHIPQGVNNLPVKCRSRIPLRASETDWRLPSMRQFRKYTLPTQRQKNFRTKEYQNNEVIGDCIRPTEMTSWSAYRCDTMAKFETMFKFFAKRRNRSSNMIDAIAHAHWLGLAGISVDRDARMFKRFAGRKIVLTLGEYKSLIDQLCVASDADFWDVLRKMATCQDEDMR